MEYLSHLNICRKFRVVYIIVIFMRNCKPQREHNAHFCADLSAVCKFCFTLRIALLLFWCIDDIISFPQSSENHTKGHKEYEFIRKEV